ncbi:MAG: ATP-binding protein [Clostridia bacterium]|nr:ATP-binding protein [Clostridia bacterium]
MKSIIVPAVAEELDRVQEFVEAELEAYDCPMRAMMQINIVVEEIFVNIASYAYRPEVGDAEICCEVDEDPLRVTIQFLDHGKPFDPLAQEDADTSPEALLERDGGLGILLVKKSMDAVDYSYKDGKNILTIIKNLDEE